jgi:hypothetical protein
MSESFLIRLTSSISFNYIYYFCQTTSFSISRVERKEKKCKNLFYGKPKSQTDFLLSILERIFFQFSYSSLLLHEEMFRLNRFLFSSDHERNLFLFSTQNVFLWMLFLSKLPEQDLCDSERILSEF